MSSWNKDFESSNEWLVNTSEWDLRAAANGPEITSQILALPIPNWEMPAGWPFTIPPANYLSFVWADNWEDGIPHMEYHGWVLQNTQGETLCKRKRKRNF